MTNNQLLEAFKSQTPFNLNRTSRAVYRYEPSDVQGRLGMITHGDLFGWNYEASIEYIGRHTIKCYMYVFDKCVRYTIDLRNVGWVLE